MSCMQSIESVSSGRQRGEEEEEKRSPLWKRQGARGGVYYDYYFMKKMKHKTHFLTPPAPPPPKKTPSINLFFLLLVGNYQWRSITGCLVFGRWEERGNVERERDVRWRDGGLGEVKGQRKKGGTFSEDGRLEKKQRGTITPMFKRLFSAPPTSPPTPRRGSTLKSGSLWHFPLRLIWRNFFFFPKREIIFLSFSLFSIFYFFLSHL